ncbi:DUF5131 family protein [Roseateles chitinivorans]|uniref:DUF5131 family protein n=1 Tax=Roseateles chitinivorans TaxID=2917965 RepID=UPI00117F6223
MGAPRLQPWWGYVKVSPARDHCYAESWAKRVNSDVWGRITAAVLQRCPLEGAIEVERGRNGRGVRRCVFCASMADVFENRPDLIAPRQRPFFH